MYVDILKALASNGPLKITYIMYKANMNCSVTKQFLDSLIQQRLVEEQTVHKKKRKTVYAITERGKTALNHFKEIRKSLQTNEETQRSYVFT